MADRRSGGRRVAVVRAVLTATALAFPLWLTSCSSPSPSATAPPSSAPLAAAAPDPHPTEAALPADPAPQPQDPPPPGAAASPVPLETQASGPPATSTGTSPGGTSVPGTGPSAVPASEDPAPSAQAPSGGTAARRAVTAYYVLLDDGGSKGVRFGCNDSLVGVVRTSPGGEPLPAAVGALLEAPTEAVLSRPASDLYNALSGSDLKFLSGSFDGTTVTLYLAGTLRLGGVCDIPRVEAQLAQTAVAAVGAVRAEIYVNGRGLAEVLRLD
ncbi:hypothetical protein QFZ36_002400 [Pseudarthrobacter siccitolerans]|uniref:Lipoprotein n=1 Tax=Pseudarthrobacter siccitolerans TaxID=861266 RepID=A0ABU0PNK4_9MICC|nr:hypothetical protein [Pseudarthrobacter siccitolerans]MDQ0674839.1 hypothetical protein [Pseudarthrobacter siccitolerans]